MNGMSALMKFERVMLLYKLAQCIGSIIYSTGNHGNSKGNQSR